MPRKLSKIKNAMVIESGGESVGRLDVSGEVGFDWYGDAWDASWFKMQMDGLGDVNRLEVHINSPGGSVIDGIAIFNYLVQHPAEVHVYVDGVAASIASVISMAGDKIFMPSNTLQFVHEPWMYTSGSADELRKDAEMLDTMKGALTSSYMRHFKGTEEEMDALLKTETWFTAAEMAEKFNNVEVLAQEAKITASLDMSKLSTEIPDGAKAFLETEEGEPKSYLKRMINFLRGEGLNKAADGLEEDITEEPKPEEEEMTPDERAAMKAEMKKEVMAELKEAGVVAPTEELAPKAVLTFEGDPTDAAAVQAHVDALNQAQLQASVDWSNPTSVAAYQKAAFGKTEPVPGSNADVPETSPDAKAQDKLDTRNHMEKFMPNGGK